MSQARLCLTREGQQSEGSRLLPIVPKESIRRADFAKMTARPRIPRKKEASHDRDRNGVDASKVQGL